MINDYPITIVNRKEGEIVQENTLAWTDCTENGGRHHLDFRWRESDGVEKMLRIAVNGEIHDVVAVLTIRKQ